MFSVIKKVLKNIIFPKFCLGCGREGNYLCEDCKSTLDILENQKCLCNKNPLLLPDAGKCKKCSSKKLSGLYYATSYKENYLIKRLISNFKHEPYVKELAQPFSLLIIDHFLLSGKNLGKIFKKSILVPVPLYKKELKKRGFNPATLLAEALSENLKNHPYFPSVSVPVVEDCLIKTEPTPTEIKLKKENIKDSFSCQNPKEIKGKKIFLIDDVYTTGATIEEATKTLKKAGAKRVFGITVAREG